MTTGVPWLLEESSWSTRRPGSLKVAYIVALLNPPGCVCPLTEASFTWNIRMSSYLDFWQGTPPIDCKCFVMCGRSLGRKVCLSRKVPQNTGQCQVCRCDAVCTSTRLPQLPQLLHQLLKRHIHYSSSFLGSSTYPPSVPSLPSTFTVSTFRLTLTLTFEHSHTFAVRPPLRPFLPSAFIASSPGTPSRISTFLPFTQPSFFSSLYILSGRPPLPD